MATAPRVSIQWIPEDDLLLKNAVEVILVADFVSLLANLSRNKFI